MQLSYWEIKSWISNIDYTIVGSGIVGLSCAITLKEKFPKAHILILEKGMLPQGASTKNAGFACFGSLSEIIDDLKTHSEQEVIDLVQKRVTGLHLLRQKLGDSAIDYKQYGGYELFKEEDSELYENCQSKLDDINKLLQPIFKSDIFTFKKNTLKFKHIQDYYSYNPFEGQIDTGEMMTALLQKAIALGIKILNNCEVEQFENMPNSVSIKTNSFAFKTSKLLIATNGFASELIGEKVRPARAQVLITEPIKNLYLKGTFHFDRGYYYFRNINNRILFGGGRNLDVKTEETTVFGQTDHIQSALESLLKTTIIPDLKFEIAHRWSGIMGIGNQKKAIVKQLNTNVYCGVRLGGMGIAIGSLIGKELADLT